MVVMLDGRNVTHYVLESIRVASNADGVNFDVIAEGLPEDNNILKTFSSEADANAFIKKAQQAIAAATDIPYIDLRTPTA